MVQTRKPPFLALHLSISNGFVSSEIYDKRNDFDFDKVEFPFLDGDIPRRTSYEVYISQLSRVARGCSHEEEEEVYYPRNRSMEVEGILH